MDRKEELIKGDTVGKYITFPLSIWVDFEKLAQGKYGNCYWLAIKDMVEKTKAFDSMMIMRVDMDNLNERMGVLEQKLFQQPGNALSEAEEKQEDKPTTITLGNNGVEF